MNNNERKFPLGFTPDFDLKKAMDHYVGKLYECYDCGVELTVIEAEVNQIDERVYCRLCFMNK